MSCDCTRIDLLAHLHGELDAQQHALVGRHLTMCPQCALESSRLRTEVASLVEYLHVPAPAGLEARILGHLRRKQTSRAALASRNAASICRAMALAAASVAGALTGLRVISPQAFGIIINTSAIWGSRASELLSQHIPAWPSLIKAFSGLALLVGL